MRCILEQTTAVSTKFFIFFYQKHRLHLKATCAQLHRISSATAGRMNNTYLSFPLSYNVTVSVVHTEDDSVVVRMTMKDAFRWTNLEQVFLITVIRLGRLKTNIQTCPQHP